MMTLGRVLLGLYFLVPGIMKFAAWDMHMEMMRHHGVPFEAPMLFIAAAAEIIGGLLLITNRYVRFTALGCVLLILLINLNMHGFWNFTGIEAAHETQSFVKNLGILAGLLVLASVSPKRSLKLKGIKKSDSSFRA
jgi:putative oxidoreductase